MAWLDALNQENIDSIRSTVETGSFWDILGTAADITGDVLKEKPKTGSGGGNNKPKTFAPVTLSPMPTMGSGTPVASPAQPPAMSSPNFVMLGAVLLMVFVALR